jgi:hypothetical protein
MCTERKNAAPTWKKSSWPAQSGTRANSGLPGWIIFILAIPDTCMLLSAADSTRYILACRARTCAITRRLRFAGRLSPRCKCWRTASDTPPISSPASARLTHRTSAVRPPAGTSFERHHPIWPWRKGGLANTAEVAACTRARRPLPAFAIRTLALLNEDHWEPNWEPTTPGTGLRQATSSYSRCS